MEWNNIKDKLPEHLGRCLVKNKRLDDYQIAIFIVGISEPYWNVNGYYKELNQYSEWMLIKDIEESEVLKRQPLFYPSSKKSLLLVTRCELTPRSTHSAR